MTRIIKKSDEQKYQTLYEELEVRYGAGLAQEIVDQIKKTEEQDNRPEFMAVKALSEALEIVRGQTQKTIKKLRFERSKPIPAKVANMEIKRLQKDLAQLLECYWLIQHGFYKAHAQAMKICEVPETYRYARYTHPTKMAA